MSDDRERQLVILALERGLVSAEQVEACRRLQEQSGGENPPSILRLLAIQGHLSPEQVFQLATEQQLEEHLMEIENCELVRELGASALGTTCLLEDKAADRRYVVKVLDPSLHGDRGYMERLEHQVALAMRLQHANVVRTLGLGEKFGSAFVASEHVEGASLADLLSAKGKLETHEVLSVAIAAATALKKARELGLVHGAVSPRNLLVGRDGTVQLADLGVARPRRVEVSLTRRGVGIRSPDYLAPEQFDPDAELDSQSDLFSLGAVLYHCLSGRVPFRGDTTAEVIGAIRTGEFEPLSEAAPGVPLGFGAVVEMLLQADPAQRYANPSALLADLHDLQSGRVPSAQRKAIAAARAARLKAEPVDSGQVAPSEVELEEVPKRGALRWVLTGVAVAVLAAALGAVWLFTRPGPKGKPPEELANTSTAVVDPVKRAREGREAIEQALKPTSADAAKDPAAKLTAVQDKIARLQEIEKAYDGTAAAEEARKRLAPLQAEALFQTVVAYAREHPDDREAVVTRYREVVAKYGDTAAAFKAEQELDKLEGVVLKQVQRELAEARKRASELQGRQRFGEALAQFDALLKANPPEDIKQMILQEKIAITSEAERAYLVLHGKAQEKIGGRYYEEAKALYEQVVGSFGVEPYVGRAKSEIAIIAPLLKGAAVRRLEAIDAAKYQFFLTRMEPSIAQARVWDLAGAVREAEKARAALRTAGIENYLEAYLADVAMLASLKRRVVRRLNDKARPVLGRHFSLGKVGGKFDPQWLDAKVLRADENVVTIHYGKVDVARAWSRFEPVELYKLAKMSVDPGDPQALLTLGVHCLYGDLLTTATRELHAAKAGAPEAASYLERVDLLVGAAAPEATQTKQEQASRLLMEAKRMMNEREWDRALYRLALVRSRHASKDYDVSASLPEINQRIAECKRQVEKLEIESDIALGRQVGLLRESLFDEWQKRFGTWTMEKGTVQVKNTEDHDAECLFSLQHPPAYELRVKVRVVEGTGAILRLGGKARPNIGFWVHAANPALVGLLHEQAADERAAKRQARRYTFTRNKWYDIRAVVTPLSVEATIGDDYAVRMANPLPADPSGLHTYGFLVNPKSAAEFRDFSVRALSGQ